MLSPPESFRGFNCALETLQALLLDLICKETLRGCLSVLMSKDIFLQPLVGAPLKAQEICVGNSVLPTCIGTAFQDLKICSTLQPQRLSAEQ